MFTGFFNGALKGLVYALILLVACAMITIHMEGTALGRTILLGFGLLAAVCIAISWVFTWIDEREREYKSRQVHVSGSTWIYSAIPLRAILFAGYYNSVLWAFIIGTIGGIIENLTPGLSYIGVAGLGLGIIVGLLCAWYTGRVYPDRNV